MDTQTNLGEIIATLQRILSDPSLLENSSAHGGSKPVLPPSIPELDVSQIQLPAEASSDGKDPLSSLASHLTTSILPYLNRGSLSPHYYGFVTGGATPASLLADLLTSIFDQNVQVHLPSETLATTLEAATVNLLLDLFDLPRQEWGCGKSGSGSGTFTTGATASNILGLALGREFVVNAALARAGIAGMSVNTDGLPLCLSALSVSKIQVLSTLPHSSLTKASSVLGLGRNNVISVASATNPLDIDLAKVEVLAARKDALSIIAVSAGEVNTGCFATTHDTMATLRAIADRFGCWIHVDGAFGLFARLLPPTEYPVLTSGVAGLETADSITGDCHKLLNVPYDCGFFLTRHRALAEDVCRNGNAAYLTSGAGAGPGDGIQSPLNIGLENSRRFRALPVYAGLHTYGRHGYRDMLVRQVGLARAVASWLFHHAEFELLPRGLSEQEAVASKTFMIVLFRAKDEALNEELVARINATGRMYVSGTAWEGSKAARIAVSNWRAEEAHVEVVKEVLDGVLCGWSSAAAAAAAARA